MFSTKVVIKDCELAKTDFGFLAGFDFLTHLTIESPNYLHLSFHTLPPLISLVYLEMNQCHEINQLVSFPDLTNGLTEFRLNNNQLDLLSQETLVRVLNWTLQSSADSLTRLMIDHDRLTKVPGQQIGSFQSLQSLDVSYNSIPIVRQGSFNLRGSVETIKLKESLIETIEPGSFKGLIYFNSSFD